MGVGAHPDDLELLCGGTLAAYRARGWEVTMCSVASGDLGSVSGSSTELARRRAEEAARAAELIGASYTGIGTGDGAVDATSETQKRLLVEAIRRARPDVILTHSTNDYMEDHNQAAGLALAASFLASVPLYVTDSEALAHVPAVMFMDTLSGLGFEPVEFVDITDHIDTKLAMMRAHTSQLEWLGEHDQMDPLTQITTVAAFRGLQAGVRYAEGFRPHNVHLRARTFRLLP